MLPLFSVSLKGNIQTSFKRTQASLQEIFKSLDRQRLLLFNWNLQRWWVEWSITWWNILSYFIYLKEKNFTKSLHAGRVAEHWSFYLHVILMKINWCSNSHVKKKKKQNIQWKPFKSRPEWRKWCVFHARCSLVLISHFFRSFFMNATSSLFLTP